MGYQLGGCWILTKGLWDSSQGVLEWQLRGYGIAARELWGSG